MRVYHIYILCSASGVLYTGVTNDLERRVMQHKAKIVQGFTQTYDVTRLVYFEAFGDIRDAIAREKEIKGWRARKEACTGSPVESEIWGSEQGLS